MTNISLIRCIVPDINGKSKTKIVSAEVFDDYKMNGLSMYLGECIQNTRIVYRLTWNYVELR